MSYSRFVAAPVLVVILFSGAAAQTAAPTAGVPVREDGLVATWYPPASGKRGPVILTLGGSEGGEAGGQYLARSISRYGYGTLALAYFNAPGLPDAMQEVPLEYFGKAIAWIDAQPLADGRHVGVYGVSFGAETALLVASHYPQIKAVVAGAPSVVVWQGYNPRDYMTVKSSFTLDGKPVPFVPYDNSKAFTSVLDLYQRSLDTLASHQDAAIPVERINGPVLLLSGKADALWPSSQMADQVIKRLDAKGFRYPHQHIAYPDAGHGATTPPLTDDTSMGGRDNIGGTPDGNEAARADMWKRVVAFFGKYLGVPAR